MTSEVLAVKIHHCGAVMYWQKDSSQSAGGQWRCAPCRSVTRAKWAVGNPESVRASNAKYHAKNRYKASMYQVKRKYGLTAAQYEEMFERQGGLCAVCGALPTRRRFDVDHAHGGNVVRGLLCNGCNLALGHVQESPDRLRGLANYLERWA